jgi:hypothetical protein
MRCTLFVAIARDKDFTKIMFPMLKLYTSYGFLELFLNNTPSQGKGSMFYIVPGHFQLMNTSLTSLRRFNITWVPFLFLMGLCVDNLALLMLPLHFQ